MNDIDNEPTVYWIVEWKWRDCASWHSGNAYPLFAEAKADIRSCQIGRVDREFRARKFILASAAMIALAAQPDAPKPCNTPTIPWDEAQGYDPVKDGDSPCENCGQPLNNHIIQTPPVVLEASFRNKKGGITEWPFKLDNGHWRIYRTESFHAQPARREALCDCPTGHVDPYEARRCPQVIAKIGRVPD